jgi:hypothetical protein
MLLIPSGVQPVQLAVVFGSKLANERRVHQAVLEAASTLASSTSRRMVNMFLQVPRLRAFEHP